MPGRRIASFHLVRERPGRGVLALARLGTDRPRMTGVPGLVFWRLLGTGRAERTSVGVDPRRTALFALWEDDAALDGFLTRSPIAKRWHRADEVYTVRLRALGGHGTWRGVDVLSGMAPAVVVPATDATVHAPVAVLTRATVRLGSWPAFIATGRPVSDELRATPGLLAVAAIGEAPLGRQATFSLWRSGVDAHAFARDAPVHREAVRRTRAERWYGEELFARFQPYAARGTWDGRDPLAGPGR